MRALALLAFACSLLLFGAAVPELVLLCLAETPPSTLLCPLCGGASVSAGVSVIAARLDPDRRVVRVVRALGDGRKAGLEGYLSE